MRAVRSFWRIHSEAKRARKRGLRRPRQMAPQRPRESAAVRRGPFEYNLDAMLGYVRRPGTGESARLNEQERLFVQALYETEGVASYDVLCLRMLQCEDCPSARELVRTAVRSTRKKLESLMDGGSDEIETIYDVGYRLKK